jgi:hypothetical protein
MKTSFRKQLKDGGADLKESINIDQRVIKE